MPLFDRMDEAVKEAHPDEFIVAIEWQGKSLTFATVVEPQKLPVPKIVIMQRPKVMGSVSPFKIA